MSGFFPVSNVFSSKLMSIDGQLNYVWRGKILDKIDHLC